MRLSLALLGLSLLATHPGGAQNLNADATVPAHARAVLHVEGRGVQIYTCAQPGGVSYEWALKAPEAKLFDASSEEVGTHGAGPTWTWKDGSSITGKLLEKRASADALSVPWLLLAATRASDRPGALAGIAFVRRSETQGGVAPADGCDASHAGATVRVPYTATYTFYKSE
jgi:hypothetical protein